MAMGEGEGRGRGAKIEIAAVMFDRPFYAQYTLELRLVVLCTSGLSEKDVRLPGLPPANILAQLS